MGHNAARSQQAKAKVREARLGLLSERQAQDQRIEDATVRTVLAWEDAAAAQTRLDAAEREAGEALAALVKEKVSAAQMVTLTGIGKPQCARLLRIAGAQAQHPVEGDSSRDTNGDGGDGDVPGVGGLAAS